MHEQLGEYDGEEGSHFHLFEEVARDSPELRATLVEGVCRSGESALMVRDLLRDGCAGDEALRRDLVAAFDEAGREQDLFLGAALLTHDDGAALLRDYFEKDGEPADVVDWLSLLCDGYRREKRKGNVETEYDGIFQDAWDAVKEAGKTIGQTIDDAVDKLQDALDSVGDFTELVTDLVEFSQRRINAVVDKLFEKLGDAGEAVGKLMQAVENEAYRTVKAVVKAVRNAGASLETIFDKVSDLTADLVRHLTRALKEARESMGDMIKTAANRARGVVEHVAKKLVELADSAIERWENIKNWLEDALEDAQELIDDIKAAIEYILSGEWVQDAKDAFGDTVDVKALLRRAADRGRDALEAVFRGLLSARMAVGRILELVQEVISDAFTTAVSILEDLVPDETLYASTLSFGVLGAVVKALFDLGTSLSDVIAWAGEKGAAAVNAIAAVFSELGELSRDAVFRLGEALQSVGEDLTAFLSRAIEWGKNKAYVAFYGVLAGGGDVIDLMRHIYNETTDWLRQGIKIFRRIGVRIWDLLGAASRIAGDFLRDLVRHLIEMGYSVWYILDWAADTVNRAQRVLEGMFETIMEISKELEDLVAWCARRTADVMQAGFAALISIVGGVGTILIAILSDPDNVFSTAVRELREAGGDLEAFFRAVADAGGDLVGRLYRALRNIGVDLVEMLQTIRQLGEDTFVQLAERLLDIGVDAFEMILWAVDTTFKVFGWVMDAIEAVFDSLMDVLEWVADAAPEPIEWVADWLAQRAREGFEWVRDEIVAPLLAAGKFYILVTLVNASLPFLIVAYAALGSLVDEDATPYKHWPDDFRAFECHVRANAKELRAPSDDHGIVVISDLHMEDQDDIDAGLGHFHKNAGLVRSVLDYYATPDRANYEWTLVVNGDSEEFWKDNDLTTNEPSEKIGSIASTHPGVHRRLSEEFYKFEFPRRLVKLVGNHDAAYDDPHVVNTYRDHGFPDIEVYDYVTTQYDGNDLIIMHGHQFDPYNCDANNDFGKFASNFASEPIDTWSDTLTDFFGEDARIEGETLKIPGLPDIPVDILAPYYEKDDWQSLVRSDGDPSVLRPEIQDWMLFDEHTVADQINDMETSMILGHTHIPKLMRSGQDNDVFYANGGTSGWWEGCVWTIEITEKNVRLVGWTDGSDGPERTYVVGLDDPSNDPYIDTSKENHLTTADYDHNNATF